MSAPSLDEPSRCRTHQWEVISETSPVLKCKLCSSICLSHWPLRLPELNNLNSLLHQGAQSNQKPQPQLPRRVDQKAHLIPRTPLGQRSHVIGNEQMSCYVDNRPHRQSLKERQQGIYSPSPRIFRKARRKISWNTVITLFTTRIFIFASCYLIPWKLQVSEKHLHSISQTYFKNHFSPRNRRLG